MVQLWGKVKAGLRRNVIYVVMIPSLALLYYGWEKVQQNPAFVPEHMYKESPFIRVSCLIAVNSFS